MHGERDFPGRNTVQQAMDRQNVFQLPVIGEPILRIMRGGEDLSAVTLARFFGTHVWVLPTLLLLLVGFHMYLVIRLGISAVPKKGE